MEGGITCGKKLKNRSTREKLKQCVLTVYILAIQSGVRCVRAYLCNVSTAVRPTAHRILLFTNKAHHHGTVQVYHDASTVIRNIRHKVEILNLKIQQYK